ncbi:beta-1,3-galactosyl-O-glycosyl-glycoprotein beta-1,6-N-acetylglucosaminyltransferase 7 [Denticeps clupeoides]|uniref:Glucosaminyl (N-acetyl) transferase family member 7 n=1 Tax=Denticeps clupeoides TaxID=299321 RepID=A0AAY4EI76_9TELE|nr:beta-1,3-galactosyl-O-glycosyl-glycoprotein beta-1,6-N-acetylglucosaminyltransferase 7-like [Denticeps clupeoides]
MLQLESAKCTFLFCLCVSLIICSIIYLRAANFYTPSVHTRLGTARRQCPGPIFNTNGTRWFRAEGPLDEYFQGTGLGSCTQMMLDLHFVTSPLSKEEEDYPLAFIITIHKEFETFVRLLRAIYAPQNIYCVHVDQRSTEEYKDKVRTLVGCFPNIILATVSEKVIYGGFTRLKADINCMEDLVKSHIAWKKVVNLCGQDFPIQTNLELVRYMQSKEWRDRNMTPGVKQPKSMRYRTSLQYVEVASSYVAQRGRGHKKTPPPHDLEIYFGTAYYSLTRVFVEFVLKSPVARDFLEWSKDTYSPDEHYWVTLNHIQEAPGSHVNGGWEGAIRAIKWKEQEGLSHQGCKGHYLRDICVYGLEDLKWIVERNSMFANKFESKTSAEALDCLEHWHREKVFLQAMVPIQPSWQLLEETHMSADCNTTSGPALQCEL